MKYLPLLLGMILQSSYALAQTIVQAEYFIDADAGIGNNNPVVLSPPLPDGTYSFNVDLSGLQPGNYKLYVRTKDSEGVWSVTSRRNIEVTASNTTKIFSAGEYFFDTDPGFGRGTAIEVMPNDSVLFQHFTAVTASLAEGYHKLYIRTRDNKGHWSHTLRRNVELIRADTYVIAGAEYFFIADSGIGHANPVIFEGLLPADSFYFKIPINQIPTGAHTLYIRVKDSVNGSWSLTQQHRDSVITSVQAGVWSQPGTWSNNQVPDSNTVVVIHHDVEVDIPDAVCKSLVPYRNNARCIIRQNMKLRIAGYRRR